MLPTWQQIEKAAYDRWERRGWVHGHDRDDWVAVEQDLTFDMNYQTLCQLPLAASDVPGDSKRLLRCRFCEQTVPRVEIGASRPVFPPCVHALLSSREICSECDRQFETTIDQDFTLFWHALGHANSFESVDPATSFPATISIGAYKALIRMAILLLPERELASFADTIEWVANPDHDFDGGLFQESACLVYQTHVASEAGWAGLTRRKSDESPFPFMLFFLASGRLVLQVHLPLCAQDDELDGSELRVPHRSFSTGTGHNLWASTCLVLPVKPADSTRQRRIRLFA
jgi:hypothetical protein